MSKCNDIVSMDVKKNIVEEIEYVTNTCLANDKANLVTTINNKHVPHLGIQFYSDREAVDYAKVADFDTCICDWKKKKD